MINSDIYTYYDTPYPTVNEVLADGDYQKIEYKLNALHIGLYNVRDGVVVFSKNDKIIDNDREVVVKKREWKTVDKKDRFIKGVTVFLDFQTCAEYGSKF